MKGKNETANSRHGKGSNADTDTQTDVESWHHLSPVVILQVITITTTVIIAAVMTNISLLKAYCVPGTVLSC